MSGRANVLAGILMVLLSQEAAGAEPADKHISLTIDLRGGFNGQQVMLRVDGHRIVDMEQAVSDPSLGLAKRYVYKTTAGVKKFEVRIIDGGKEKSFDIELRCERDMAIGVSYAYYHSINAKDVMLLLSHHPFSYE